MRALIIVMFLVSTTLVATVRAQIAVPRIDLVNESVKLEGQSSISGLALRCHVVAADLDSNVSFVPSIGYWRDSDRFPEFGIQHVSQRDWTFGVDARYRFSPWKSFRAFLGGGVAIHAIGTKFRRTGEPEVSSDLTRPGLNVLAGIEFPPAVHIQSSVEIAYHAVSHFGQFKLNWVVGFRL